MNYNKYKTYAFTVKKMRLDINGNMVKELKFYKQNNSQELKHYKTIKTNETIDHLSNDEIINVWG